MRDITVVIPTRNRLAKLRNTLSTIPNLPWLTTYIVCDADSVAYTELLSRSADNFKLKYVAGHSGSVYCRNLVAPECSGGYLYATDDLEFTPGIFEQARDLFNTKFRDDDGVLGFSQIPASFHPTGVALIGKKFMHRYPDKHPFYPEYFHFSCQEVHELAVKVGKFHLMPEVGVKHLYPHGESVDLTHHEARAHKAKDFATRKARKAQGIIWGDKEAKSWLWRKK